MEKSAEVSLECLLYILNGFCKLYFGRNQIERRADFLATWTVTACEGTNNGDVISKHRKNWETLTLTIDPAEITQFLIAFGAVKTTLRLMTNVLHPGNGLHKDNRLTRIPFGTRSNARFIRRIIGILWAKLGGLFAVDTFIRPLARCVW